MLNFNHQRGMTLVELMIAGSISLLVVSAVTAIYQATAAQSLRQLETLHLHSTVQGILDLMSADIQRSGYWHFLPGKQQLKNNPFQSPANTIQTGAARGEPPDSCVVFSYDLDKDGKLGVGKCPVSGCLPQTDADNLELFGFRLRNQSLQMRYAGNRADCQGGYWQALTDASISVSDFRVTLQQSCLNLADSTSACNNGVDRQIIRTVSIELAAHNARRTAIHTELQRTITIRNDRFIAAGVKTAADHQEAQQSD